MNLTKREKQLQDNIAFLVSTVHPTQLLPKIERRIEDFKKESKSFVDAYHIIKGLKGDTIYHFNYNLEKELGKFSFKTNGGASGDNKPQFENIEIGFGKTLRVPMGKIYLPSLGEDNFINISYDNDDNELIVRASLEDKYQDKLSKVVANTILDVRKNSIYTGEILLFGKRERQPKFLSKKDITKTKVFLSEDVQTSLLPVIGRITKTKEFEKSGIDIKHGLILSGEYGTGKTLLANYLALLSVRENWTFAFIKDVRDFGLIYENIKNLADSGNGLILFVEDIDLIFNSKRDADMNEVLNLLDGTDTKNKNVITIFTTNHLEKINPTALRGKRIGTLIKMSNLDKKGNEEFLRYYLKNDIKKDLDLTDALNILEENKIVPAFLSEIVEKLKANKIVLDKEYLSIEDIIKVINSYTEQSKLVKEAYTKAKKNEGNNISTAMKTIFKPISNELTTLYRRVDNLDDYVKDNL